MGRKPKEKDDQIITDDEFLEINKKDIKKEENNNYFMIKDKVEFFSSGCTQLDCILGGGWAERRTFNIIGDKMTSKTGNSVEACINFMLKYPNGRVYYIETEAALDT